MAVPEEPTRSAMLDLEVERGPVTNVALSGDLDPSTAPLLEAAVDELVADESVTRVELDLGSLAFIDSSGLRVFVTAREALSRRGAQLALRNPTDNTRRLLDITGLGEIIDVQ